MDEITKTFVFYLTIVLILIKCSLVVFLAKKVINKKRNKIEAGVKFLGATAGLMAGLSISRILFTVFDFQITNFDSSTYAEPDAVITWKIAFFVSTVTLVYMIWVLDKVIMQNKFKGIPSVILVIVGIVVLVFPVKKVEDFQLMSVISLISNLMSLLFPAVFLYVGKNSSGDIRKVAYLVAFGLILYAITLMIVNEMIITSTSALLGFDTGILLWIISISGKCIGLIIFAQSAAKFVSD